MVARLQIPSDGSGLRFRLELKKDPLRVGAAMGEDQAAKSLGTLDAYQAVESSPDALCIQSAPGIRLTAYLDLKWTVAPRESATIRGRVDLIIIIIR